MKKFLLLCLCSVIFLPSFAQKIETKFVPMTVKNTLLVKVNDTVNPLWEKGKDFYTATLVKGELKGAIQIKETGEWIETIWTIPFSAVPNKIKDHILKTFPDYKVLSTTIQYRSDGNYYIFEIKKKKDIQTLYYNLLNEFIKAEPKTVPPK